MRIIEDTLKEVWEEVVLYKRAATSSKNVDNILQDHQVFQQTFFYE